MEANLKALSAYGQGLEKLRAVLAAANVNHPKGGLRDQDRSWVISANDQLTHANQYRPLVVGMHNGTAVRVNVVSRVEAGGRPY